MLKTYYFLFYTISKLVSNPSGIAYSSCQVNSFIEVSTTTAKNGSIFSVYGYDFDTINVMLFIGGTLVGMYLVCDCREGGTFK